MVLDFPDVIKSAESSPRHSLVPISDYYDARQTRSYIMPEEHRTKEIISEISEEITRAVGRGRSPYFIYGMKDDDEETWC